MILNKIGICTHIFFSPDGNWLAFDVDREGILKRVFVDGGPPVEICTLPGRMYGGSWGADGTVVFATLSGGLWRVPSSGGEPELLTTPDAGNLYAWPEILPDGQAVLFTILPVFGRGDGQLAVVSLGGGAPKRLDVRGSYPRYVSSGHLVYSVDGALRAVSFIQTG